MRKRIRTQWIWDCSWHALVVVDGWLIWCLVCCGHGSSHHKKNINFYFIVCILCYFHLVRIYIYIWISSFQLYVSCDLGIWIFSGRVCNMCSHSRHLCRVYLQLLLHAKAVWMCFILFMGDFFFVRDLESRHFSSHNFFFSLPTKLVDCPLRQ